MTFDAAVAALALVCFVFLAMGPPSDHARAVLLVRFARYPGPPTFLALVLVAQRP